MNCYKEHGATDLENPIGSAAPKGQDSEFACRDYCSQTPAPGGTCTAITYDKKGKKCYRRRDVDTNKCDRVEGYITYIAKY